MDNNNELHDFDLGLSTQRIKKWRVCIYLSNHSTCIIYYGHFLISMYYDFCYIFFLHSLWRWLDSFNDMPTKRNLPNIFTCSEILKQSRSSINTDKPDVHARLMRYYNDVIQWWFLILLAGNMALPPILSIIWKDDIQLQWWGMLLACGLACILSLRIGVI